MSGRSTEVPIGFLDSPPRGAVLHGVSTVEGWALSQSATDLVIEIWIDGERVEVEVERVVRPDVVKAYPWSRDHGAAGFEATVNWTLYADGGHSLSCVASGEGGRTELGFVDLEVRNGPVDAFYGRIHTYRDRMRRERKLATILSILACPECLSSLTRRRDGLTCSRCEVEYPILGSVPVLVRGAPTYPIEASRLASPSSNHQYPDLVLNRLEAVLGDGGLALDVGAGRRSFGAEGLVQLEICNYPFTDVVSQSNTLPFADAAFDLVVSLAVTEHVERPWVLATEIQRVTKPGGDIVVDSAFLQPVHGYPEHFYNMTAAALRSLFLDTEVLSLGPAPYQHPWFSVRWILSSLLAELDPDSRALLSGMTVGRLLEEASRFCREGSGVLSQIRLEPHRLEELAAGFTLHCRKPR